MQNTKRQNEHNVIVISLKLQIVFQYICVFCIVSHFIKGKSFSRNEIENIFIIVITAQLSFKKSNSFVFAARNRSFLEFFHRKITLNVSKKHFRFVVK